MAKKPNITNKEISMESSITKSIKDFAVGRGSDNSPMFVITFMDNTFATLTAQEGPEDEIEIFPQFMLDKDFPINSLDNIIDFGDDILVNIGAFAEEEIREVINDLKQRKKKIEEERDKQQYERLKKKFGEI